MVSRLQGLIIVLVPSISRWWYRYIMGFFVCTNHDTGPKEAKETDIAFAVDLPAFPYIAIA